MKKLNLKSLMIGILLGMMLLLVSGLAAVHVGGSGTYFFSMNDAGTIGAVIDSRTSEVRVLDLENGTVTQEMRVFKESERKVRNFR